MDNIDIGEGVADALRGQDHGPARFSASEMLCLAAAPTFAAMALLTVALGGPGDVLCGAASTFPLGGMAPMYVLMAAFHTEPWLKLMARQRGGIRPPRAD